MARQTLDIDGGGGRPISGELTCWEEVPQHGIVMLPGQGYTCHMPAFYYLEEMALDLGAAVLSLAPHYRNDEQFSAWPLLSEQRNRLRDDVEASVAALLDAHSITELTVIAKSLTTLGLAGVEWTKFTGAGRTVRLVWLTPLLRDAEVVEKLSTTDVASLIVIGTGDHHFDQPTIDRLSKRSAISIELIGGAGHSFGQRGDIDRSLANIGQVVKAARSFVFPATL